MFKRTLKMTALTGVLVFSTGLSLAADQDQDRTRLLDQDQTKDQIQDQTRDRDRIYGSQMMTQAERNQYRKQMRSATTAKKREQIRAEHHKRMQERAKERGLTIHDMPPARGSMGGGMGPGGGMAPGGGMGGSMGR